MPGTNRCPNCGSPVNSGTPGSSCPRCLLKMGLEGARSTARESELSTREAAQPLSGEPDRIGPYRILQQLGEGGMGIVYLAEQREPIERRVALKVIKLGMDTRDIITRFEIERRVLALMDHPNIAKVFDAGVTEQGRPYFAMEYVRGVPITDYCDDERLDTHQRLELFAVVCEAVQHAHQKGVIHRDLKPSNVLVAFQDGRPVPKIIDFGVAKATELHLAERTIFTRFGQLIGTPEYMSPEQADPSALDIDTRTDVYALGVLLYELLVGQLPFDRKELRQAGYDEIRRKIREEDPPKPSTRASHGGAAAASRRLDSSSLARELGGDLDWIVMKTLEKDRTRRYPSASELRADVERHLHDQPVVAGPPDVTYRMRKFVRRHTAGVVFGVTVFVLLASFAATMAVQARRIAAERDRANREAATSRRVSDFLVDLFKVVDPGEARGNTITAREVLDRGAKRIDRQLVDHPFVQARLLETMGTVYSNLGLFDRALALAESSTVAHQQLKRVDTADVARSARLLGHLYKVTGRFEEAEETLEGALAQAQAGLGLDHATVAGLLGELATVYQEQQQLDRAEELYARARDVYESSLGPEDPATAMLLHNYANLLSMMGRFDEAEPLYLDAIESWTEELGPDHPNLALALLNLGLNRARAGRFDEAEHTLLECLELQRELLGPEHVLVAGTLRNLGLVYGSLGDMERSISVLRESLEVFRSVLGEDHPEHARSLNDLGIALWRNEDREEARTVMRQATEIKEQVLGSDNPDFALSLGNLAMMAHESGESERAEELYLRARAIMVEGFGPEHPQTVMTSHNLANLYTEMERFEEALELYEFSQRAWEERLGVDHPNVIMALYSRGMFHLRRGDPENGIPYVERGLGAAVRTFGDRHAKVAALHTMHAALHLATGNRERALECVRAAIDTGQPVDLDDPDLAGLRGSPEFEALRAGP